MSAYCGAFGESYAAGGRVGRFLPRSIYVPQLAQQQRSDVTLTEDDEVTAPVQVVEKRNNKMQLGGDASLTVPIPEAPIQASKPVPVQCKDGFIYSVYANPDFREHEQVDTPTPSDDEVTQPIITESTYIREHDRFQRDANTARLRLEEANRKLAELDLMRSTTNVHGSGRRVGFEAHEEASATQLSYNDIPAAKQSQPAKRYDGPLAESYYYGLPNNSVPAYSRPNEYHYAPNAQQSEQQQEYAAPQPKRHELAFSQYHYAELQDEHYGDE